MSKVWQEKAAEIGRVINIHAVVHPELEPLQVAWVNFAKKYRVAGVVHKRNHKAQMDTGDSGLLSTALNNAGLQVITRNELQQMRARIGSQAEEIAALEYRIKTLLEI